MADTEIIAHRGGAYPGVTENSLRAFTRAAALGLRWCETDVHASSDGVLYAVHDPDLSRTAGIDSSIGELSSARLDRIALHDGSPLPRLTDVFEAAPLMRLNVDIKADSGVEPMIRLARDPAFARRLRLASFSTRRLRKLSAALPDIPRSAGSAEVALVVAAGRAGARALPAGVDALQVPERQGVAIVTPRFVDAVHAGGREVHVWTVNDEPQMDRLIDLGVDGLVTDEVETALRAVHS